MSSLPQPLPPVPVQPIVYSSPVPQRPGIITAIGVISIVVGSLGLMFNGIAGLQAFAMVMMSNASKTAVAAQQARQKAAAVQPAKPVDPLSMPLADRQNVLRGLAMHRAITKPRREQLDALLVKCGRQIFRLQGGDLTVDVVRQNVTESGRLPDAKGGEGPDFFIIGEGRIELADDHAKFVPGGGAETVRVSASDAGEQPNWQAGLTTAQVKAIIDKVEAQAGGALNDAQKTKLEQALSSPAQAYFEPVPTLAEAASQVTSVSFYNMGGTSGGTGGGQLTISTQQGMLVLDGQGNTVNSMTWGGAGGPAFVGPTFNVNMKAAAISIACAVLGAALAVYLLVIGILMLRQHPRGGRLHKIYAWLKIPIAVAGGIAWVVFWTSLAMTGTGATSAGFTPAIILSAAVAVLVGLLYPVSLLVALRTRAVREYYATVT